MKLEAHGWRVRPGEGLYSDRCDTGVERKEMDSLCVHAGMGCLRAADIQADREVCMAMRILCHGVCHALYTSQLDHHPCTGLGAALLGKPDVQIQWTAYK